MSTTPIQKSTHQFWAEEEPTELFSNDPFWSSLTKTSEAAQNNLTDSQQTNNQEIKNKSTNFTGPSKNRGIFDDFNPQEFLSHLK